MEIPYFFTCIWYLQSAAEHVTRLSRHSVRLDEWIANSSPFSIQGSLWEISWIVAANTEKSVSLTDSDVQTFPKGKKPINEKKNQKLRIQWF